MLDDNKIKQAAIEAADLYEQDLPMMSYDEDKEVDGKHNFCKEFGAELFKDGAKWAINEFLKDLWHPIEEEPTIVGEEIVLEVFINNKRHTIVQNYMVGENPIFRSSYETIRWITNWSSLLNPKDGVVIKRWLYLDDLFPKEGDNHD